MINPNKSYKQKVVAEIVKIDSLDSYIPYVTIKMSNGQLVDGSLKDAYSRPHLLKVGDKVRFAVQYSITGQRFMIESLIKVRA